MAGAKPRKFTRRFLRFSALAAALALLGGCMNDAPTAREDPFCRQYIPAHGEVVNYGCVSGRALGHRRHHRRRWASHPSS
jgi:hypothetical protein